MDKPLQMPAAKRLKHSLFKLETTDAELQQAAEAPPAGRGSGSSTVRHHYHRGHPLTH